MPQVRERVTATRAIANKTDRELDVFSLSRAPANIPGFDIGIPLIPARRTQPPVKWATFLAFSLKASFWKGSDVTLVRKNTYNSVTCHFSLGPARHTLRLEPHRRSAAGHTYQSVAAVVFTTAGGCIFKCALAGVNRHSGEGLEVIGCVGSGHVEAAVSKSRHFLFQSRANQGLCLAIAKHKADVWIPGVNNSVNAYQVQVSGGISDGLILFSIKDKPRHKAKRGIRESVVIDGDEVRVGSTNRPAEQNRLHT